MAKRKNEGTNLNCNKKNSKNEKTEFDKYYENVTLIGSNFNYFFIFSLIEKKI